MANNLYIDVSARFAQFQDSMDKVSRSATSAAGRIDKAFAGVKNTIAGLGAALSVGALSSFIKSSIDAADKLNDLSKKTGVAVDTLGGLGFAAEQSGSSLDSISDAFGKLNRAIAEAGAGSKETAEAFKLLGVSVKDSAGNMRTADEVLIDLANKFESFADGPNKVALAVKLFGKAGAEIIPVLNEGGQKIRENIEYYKRFSGITQDLASKADQFNDTMSQISLLSRAVGTRIAADLLPTLQRLAEWLKATKEQGDSAKVAVALFDGVLKAAALTLESYAFVARQAVIATGGLAEMWERLKQFDLSGIVDVQKRNLAQMTDNVRQTNDNIDRILGVGKYKQTALDIEQSQAPQRARAKRPDAPGLPDSAAAAKSKSQAEAAARALDALNETRTKAILDSEKDLAKNRLDILDHFYKEGFANEEHYWTVRQEIQRSAYEVEKRALDDLVKARRDAQIKALDEHGRTSAEYHNATKELTQTLAERNKLDNDYASIGVKDVLDRAKATEDYERSIRNLNIQLEELKGNTEQATRLRLELENTSIRRQAQQRGDVEGESRIANLENAQVAQARFNEFRERAAEINARLAIQEERIQNSLRTGAISELAALGQTEQARQNSLRTLALIQKELEDVANTSGFDKLRLEAEQFAASLEDLASRSDLIGDRVRTVFEDGFSGGFTAFREEIQETGNVLQAFSNMFTRFANRILVEIENIAAKSLADALFKTSAGESLTGLFRAMSGTAVGGGTASMAAQFPNSGFQEGLLLGSFATGTDYVPKTGLYRLHEGEAVIPANQNAGGTIDARTYVDARGATQDAIPGIVAALNSHERALQRIVSHDAYKRDGATRQALHR
jgi:ribosomal protein L12E/L44/L45/RPP1/RPP2